ncbi:hypothetical protein LCGC14_2327240 [marine sediment metagenome]|uniref:Ribbon-helix-helix protein CopG domain-containing protein n=1 Tax=marine sediment metagenome TaxID=412755 RepID=A0A0F9CGP8_9ZZZZ
MGLAQEDIGTYRKGMTEETEARPSQTLSLHVDGDLAAEIDAIARQDGVSRSEILRRLLLRNLEADLDTTERWVRQLNGIHDQLVDVIEKLEAEDWNPESPHAAVELVAGCIDELEAADEDDDE